MYVNLIAYWVINLPLCYYFAFYLDYGFKGLWIAMTIVLMAIVVAYHIIIASTDWQRAHMEAKQREEKEQRAIRALSEYSMAEVDEKGSSSMEGYQRA